MENGEGQISYEDAKREKPQKKIEDNKLISREVEKVGQLEKLADFYQKELEQSEDKLRDLVRKNQMYEEKLNTFNDNMNHLIREKDIIIDFLSEKLGIYEGP